MRLSLFMTLIITKITKAMIRKSMTVWANAPYWIATAGVTILPAASNTAGLST